MIEVQAAAYQLLSAALGAGVVFDAVPDNKPGAYVTIGDDTLINWDEDRANGKEATLTIHIYSTNTGQAATSAGYKTVKELAAAVYNALHLTRLAVDGWESTPAVCEFEQAQRSADGISRHVVQRYRILLNQ